jgi:gliding motility-associated-like protein
VKHLIFPILLSISFSLFGQPDNDLCVNALPLCVGEIYDGTTIAATTSGSDPIDCFTPTATVWYSFTTNSLGGSVTLDLTDLAFNPDPTFGQTLEAFFFETGGDCDEAPFTTFSDCGSDGVDFSINELFVLAPNTTYYVMINGAIAGATSPAECDFKISISGSAVEFPDPTVSINAINNAICQGENEPIFVTINDCIDTASYEWLYDGTTISTADIDAFSTSVFSESGTLQLIISCGNVCPKLATSNEIDFELTVVEAEAGDDKFIDQGDQVVLDGEGTGTSTWTPSESLINSTTFTPVAQPEFSTTYFLITENDGCFASDSVTVYVGELVTIFNSFTPNNDGLNDTWHILNSESFPNMVVNVYDRSGQRVFSAVNYTEESKWWDGTFKDKALPTSVYYYVIELNDSEQTVYKGPVHIIR